MLHKRAAIIALLGLGMVLSQESQVSYWSRLLVGFQETTTLYPGGGTVAYGPAKSIAEGLGLRYMQADGYAFLGIGSLEYSPPLESDPSKALSKAIGYRDNKGVVWVPIRQTAEQLGLVYRNDYGASVIALPPGKLIKVDKADFNNVERYIVSFDRDIEAKVIGKNPTQVALIGVKTFPEAPEDSGIMFEETEWGVSMTLPQGTNESRITYQPKTLLIERGKFEPNIKILIDAGHGKEDTGTIVGDVKEKDLTLSLAQKLGMLLKKAAPDRVEVIQTRNDDSNPSLLKRAQYASVVQVVVSLHATAGNKVSIFSHPDNQNLFYIENGRQTLEDSTDGTKKLLSKLIGAKGASKKLATSISGVLASKEITTNVYQNPIYMMSQSAASGVLVEVGMDQLASSAGRTKVATLLSRGIVKSLKLTEQAPKLKKVKP